MARTSRLIHVVQPTAKGTIPQPQLTPAAKDYFHIFDLTFTYAVLDEAHGWRSLSREMFSLHWLLESAFAVTLLTGTPIFTSTVVSTRIRVSRLADGALTACRPQDLVNQAILAGADGFRGESDPDFSHEGLDKRRRLVALNRKNGREALAKALKDEPDDDLAAAYSKNDNPQKNPYFVGAMEGVELVIEWVRPIIFRRTMHSVDMFGNLILNLIPYKRIDSLVKLKPEEEAELAKIVEDMKKAR